MRVPEDHSDISSWESSLRPQPSPLFALFRKPPALQLRIHGAEIKGAHCLESILMATEYCAIKQVSFSSSPDSSPPPATFSHEETDSTWRPSSFVFNTGCCCLCEKQPALWVPSCCFCGAGRKERAVPCHDLMSFFFFGNYPCVLTPPLFFNV